MSWIALTEDDIVTKLSGPETAALKTAALQSGQADPLAEIITQVVREIRGYVKACDRNALGEGATIPDELLGAAINRVRYELATRLPVASLLTEARTESNRNALSLLKEAAACRFTLEQPETEAEEESASPSMPSICKPTRRFDRCDQEGI